MNFQKEYLGEWEQNESYEKAQLLWLWYDYHTEKYDQGLWSTCPAPDDETMVMLASPSAVRMSNQNALIIRGYMQQVAKHYLISNDEIQKAKLDRFRSMSKMSKRIADYIHLDEQGKFEFIYKII